MCDQHTFEEDQEFLKKSAQFTRRQFNTLSAGAALALMLPPVANAQDVVETDVTIQTPDGVADCYFVHPASGSHPAVLIWPDILGLRPAFRAMGKRMAEAGYSVLVVNPFYRSAPSPVVPDGASFQDPDIRSIVMPMAGALNAQTHVTDARTFVTGAAAWDTPSAADNKGKRAECAKKCDASNVCWGFLFDAAAGKCLFRGGVDALRTRSFFALPAAAAGTDSYQALGW